MIKASKKTKIFSWKVCALEVLDICTQTWWALPPPLVSLTLFQAAWEAVSNNSRAQAGHDWAASHKHPNQKDKIAPSVRDPEKTGAGCVRRGNKKRNRGSTINAQGPELGRQKFHRKLTQQKPMIPKQVQIVDGVFPQVMYRTLYLLSGPGYWITVSPTLILQVILPVGPKIGTAHACFLCKPWMAYVISQKLFFDFLVSVFRGQIRLCFTCGGFQLQLILRQMYWRNSKYIKSKRWINGKAAGTCLLGGRW